MQHFYSFDELKHIPSGGQPTGQDAWVTIGSFDGVHRGHQAIITPMVQQAHAAGALAAVITFHPHPVEVLRGISESIYINAPEERAVLLGQLGIDIVLTLTFNRALANLTALEFMQQMADVLRVRRLWAGNDFSLGRNRQGNIDTLSQIGEQLGYSVHVVEKVDDPALDERISSSRIRELLRAGQAADAARLLGRPYAVDGPVIHGDGRGRGLGFPTLNVAYYPGKIIPAYGVYATWTWVGERCLPSVTSVGVRPTFDNPPQAPRVEAFLIDHTEDLYGHHVRVEFLEFLRPELRFDSVQALIDQMIQDTQKAREVLSHVT